MYLEMVLRNQRAVVARVLLARSRDEVVPWGVRACAAGIGRML